MNDKNRSQWIKQQLALIEETRQIIQASEQTTQETRQMTEIRERGIITVERIDRLTRELNSVAKSIELPKDISRSIEQMNGYIENKIAREKEINAISARLSELLRLGVDQTSTVVTAIADINARLTNTGDKTNDNNT